VTRDARLTPARADVAAAHLRGEVTAERYAEPVERRVATPLAPVTSVPDGSAAMTTQLLWGEAFDAYDEDGLWSWGQARRDGYVGYVPRACLEAADALGGDPTHRVSALSAPVFPEADFKARPGAQVPLGAEVAVAEVVEGNQARYGALASGGFVAAAHLVPLAYRAADWVAEAERLLGAPYLWGGRSPLGLDCSALVQIALASGGIACPRDSDQQETALGPPLPEGTSAARGDLVFWKGHVGIMVDPRRMLHANIHHMCAAVETLDEACRRIEATGGGPVTRRIRLA